MNRRNFMKKAAVGAASLAVPGGLENARGAGGRDRPNVLFLFVDDQRSDTLGCVDSRWGDILRTPHVDRLARQGTRFENAFVTTSICAASRASVFTGLYERTHRYTFGTPPMIEEHVRASYPMLMRRAGYHTGFVGKFGVGIRNELQAEMFDYFKPLGRNPYWRVMPDGAKRHLAQVIGDHAIDFISQSGDRDPFCLSVSFNSVHAEDSVKEPGGLLEGHYPYPRATADLYTDVEIPLPELHDPEVFESQPDFLKNSLNRKRYFWRWDTPEKYETNMRAYLRMISGVDHVIGRIVEALEKRGVADNTVIIYMGDNGYYMGERGFAGKWSHYEESLRVPLIVYDPRVSDGARGQVREEMALNLDVPELMLRFAGLEVPGLYQSRDLMPLVRGEGVAAWRGDFFCEHLMDHGGIPKWEGVRGTRYKYARYFEQDPPYEFLHDLEEDPKELRNLASEPGYRDVLERMRRRCDELRDRYGGPYKPRKKGRSSAGSLQKGVPEYVEGVRGKAAAFDGAHYLAAGTVPALAVSDSFSWSLWVNVSPKGGLPDVIAGNRVRKGGGGLQFIKLTRKHFQYFNGRGHSVSLTHGAAEGKWVHLCVVKDGAELRCYRDGKPVDSASVDFETPEMPFYLGGDPRAGESTKCLLDEVRLYRQALTAGEVERLANFQSTPHEPWKHLPLDGDDG